MTEQDTDPPRTPRRPDYVVLREKGLVTIPLPTRNALGLTPGDQLIITVENGRIVLDPATVVSRARLTPDLVQQIQEGVAEAEAGDTVYLGSFAEHAGDAEDEV